MKISVKLATVERKWPSPFCGPLFPGPLSIQLYWVWKHWFCLLMMSKGSQLDCSCLLGRLESLGVLFHWHNNGKSDNTYSVPTWKNTPSSNHSLYRGRAECFQEMVTEATSSPTISTHIHTFYLLEINYNIRTFGSMHGLLHAEQTVSIIAFSNILAYWLIHLSVMLTLH